MKIAAKHIQREWEEAQWLQLIQLTEKAGKAFYFVFKLAKQSANLSLFVAYVLTRLAWNFAKLAFFSQPYTQMIRDEQWLYRQIK